MDLGLQGKVALVTGAGSPIGFGKAIAIKLAEEGCHVVVADLDVESAEATAAEIRGLGRQSFAIKVDISIGTDVKEMVKTTLEHFSRLDILINNAGASSPFKPFVEKTEEEWDLDINTNLKGVLWCTSAVISHMIAQKSGKIVNIASGAGKVGAANVSTYSAAKAGIINFTRGIAREVGPLGINVNSVCPGVSNTGFGRNAPPGVMDMVAANTPLRRLTVPEDVANIVAFLCSDPASDITGQSISVDGGDTMM